MIMKIISETPVLEVSKENWSIFKFKQWNGFLIFLISDEIPMSPIAYDSVRFQVWFDSLDTLLTLAPKNLQK